MLRWNVKVYGPVWNHFVTDYKTVSYFHNSISYTDFCRFCLHYKNYTICLIFVSVIVIIRYPFMLKAFGPMDEDF